MGSAAARSSQKPADEPAPQAQAAGGVDEGAEQLKKLAELKDQGILTEEEFEAKKKEILAKM
jgi:hypothetical protein